MSWLESVDEHVRRLTDFKGRESRLDYWGWVISMGFLVGTVASIVVAWRAFAAFDDVLEAGGFTRIRNIFIDARLWALLGFLIAIAAATARRLHDVGRSAAAAIIPASLTVLAFWLFGELFKSQPAIVGGEGLASGDLLNDLTTDPVDTVRNGLPRAPRVWDASGGQLALCAAFSALAILTALPVLTALLRTGEAEPNNYGPVPAGIDP